MTHSDTPSDSGPSTGHPDQDVEAEDSTELTTRAGAADSDTTDDDVEDITGQVEQPAKVMRIGTMIKQLLEEVRQAPLDEAGRRRLREIHESSIKELGSGLAPDLRDELDRLSLPFGGETPSEAELRIAQAQLVGWLEGLFHGIQTALYAQQVQARAQLEQMMGRRQIAGGDPAQGGAGGPGGIVIGPDGQLIGGPPSGDDSGRGTGQYL